MTEEKKRAPSSTQPLSGEVKPGDQADELNEKDLDKVSGGQGERTDASPPDLHKVPGRL